MAPGPNTHELTLEKKMRGTNALAYSATASVTKERKALYHRHLGAELLEDGALVFARLEVARVPCQLDPLVPAVLERLNERRPLDHATQLAPTGWLKIKLFILESAHSGNRHIPLDIFRGVYILKLFSLSL